MSRTNFVVVKLNDLKLPFFMLIAVVAAFSAFLLSSPPPEEAFAPDSTYEDGIYVANLSFSDANLDIIVNVESQQIASITLADFDENERMLYEEFDASIEFLNNYVTATQSLTLPETSTITESTSILMDAIHVALSDDEDAILKTTYNIPILEDLTPTALEEDILPEDGMSLENELPLEPDALLEDIIDVPLEK